MLDERLHPAKGFRQRKQPDRFQQVEGGLLAILQAEGKRAAITAHLAERQGVLRMRLQPGMKNGGNLRVGSEPLCHREGVAIVLFHA